MSTEKEVHCTYSVVVGTPDENGNHVVQGADGEAIRIREIGSAYTQDHRVAQHLGSALAMVDCIRVQELALLRTDHLSVLAGISMHLLEAIKPDPETGESNPVPADDVRHMLTVIAMALECSRTHYSPAAIFADDGLLKPRGLIEVDADRSKAH